MVMEVERNPGTLLALRLLRVSGLYCSYLHSVRRTSYNECTRNSLQCKQGSNVKAAVCKFGNGLISLQGPAISHRWCANSNPNSTALSTKPHLLVSLDKLV